MAPNAQPPTVTARYRQVACFGNPATLIGHTIEMPRNDSRRPCAPRNTPRLYLKRNSCKAQNLIVRGRIRQIRLLCRARTHAERTPLSTFCQRAQNRVQYRPSVQQCRGLTDGKSDHHWQWTGRLFRGHLYSAGTVGSAGHCRPGAWVGRWPSAARSATILAFPRISPARNWPS